MCAGKKNIVSLSLQTVFLTLLVIIAATTGVHALDERARITVAESGAFDFSEQTFQGRGDVQVIYQDVILRGDELFINLSSGELQLQGNVLLSRDGEEIRGSFLNYNLETGEGNLSEASGQIELAEKTGIIFVAGDSVHVADDFYLVNNAQFTTCDQEQSHYHIAAKELELIVGDKVIIRKLTYYEGKIPLFYWPYLVIPLDTTAEERFFSLPVIGFSEREGYYLKNTFNYQLSSNHYGNIYLDLFSRLGVAAGIRHNYALHTWGNGSLYLYHLPHGTDPVLEAAWKHGLGGEKWDFSTDTTYQDSWLTKSLNSMNRLKITLPSLNAQGAVIYKNNPERRETRLLQYDGHWQQQLTDSWRLDLRGNWTERVRDGESLKLLNYKVETSYKKDRHTLRLTAEQQYNPNLLTDEKTSAWRTVQRLPEVEWEISDLGLAKLPLRSQIQVGRYGEKPSLVQKDRILGQLTLGSKTWRPSNRLNVTYRGEAGAAFYSGGESQSWAYGRVTLNQTLTKWLTLNSTYNQREVWGQSAFRFDAKTPQQNVTSRLSYTRQNGSIDLSGGYDFKTEKYNPLALQGHWRANENWDLSLMIYHDLNLKSLLGILPMVEYRSGDTLLKAAANYSPLEQTLKRVDAEISLPLGETWQIRYSGIYEPPKQAFAQGRITITKDLHCRSLSAAYDYVNGRVALQYTIKAFPTLPIGWDSVEGLELFELDDIAQLAGEGG